MSTGGAVVVSSANNLPSLMVISIIAFITYIFQLFLFEEINLLSLSKIVLGCNGKGSFYYLKWFLPSSHKQTLSLFQARSAMVTYDITRK